MKNATYLSSVILIQYTTTQRHKILKQFSIIESWSILKYISIVFRFHIIRCKDALHIINCTLHNTTFISWIACYKSVGTTSNILSTKKWKEVYIRQISNFKFHTFYHTTNVAGVCDTWRPAFVHGSIEAYITATTNDTWLLFVVYDLRDHVCREICTEQSRFLMTARCDSFPKRQLVGHWIADIKRDFEVIKENWEQGRLGRRSYFLAVAILILQPRRTVFWFVVKETVNLLNCSSTWTRIYCA